ncbi:hypothetical protein GCM10027435_11140 [Haloparvum alkalitolerans]|uniref:DUF7534 family protein n=1 Tax=Haloparvum alkalitolerans TaxID=1042953 RepID=UPI003CF4FC96
MTPTGRFVVWMLAFDFLGFAVGSAVAAGDPSLQPYVVGPVFVLAPVAAYLTVYRGGEDRLRGALGLPPAEEGDADAGDDESRQ